ncbi:MAG: ABC transporter ATP-binding protein [Clostridiaceae bacterium]
MSLFEAKNLGKSISGKQIVDNLNFDIKEGEIFGFVGPNGAGKTTTIRMMVNLISPTSGSMEFFGKDITSNPVKAMEKIGSVVENPDSYNYLSGWENLKQIARVRKIPDSVIKETVSLVGMESRIHDKVKKYSLGMKQRLGLAGALMADPKLLILDEPVNGLDPQGIKDFRELMLRMSQEKNMAIFLSSHLLAEVEHICDRVAFIEAGKIIRIEDLNKMADDSVYYLEATTRDDISRILYSLPGSMQVINKGRGYIVTIDKDSVNDFFTALQRTGIVISELSKYKKDLESRYMEIINGGVR